MRQGRAAIHLTVALVLLGACARTKSTLVDYLAPPKPPPPVFDAAAALALAGRVVLGEALVGGTAAHAVIPASVPPALAPAVEGGGGAVARAREQAAVRMHRALATQQLLEVWARAEGPEPKNAPDAVRQAQRLLSALGYYRGPVTGVNGPLSHAAIERFQAVHGLPETGEVTASLLVALRAAL